MHIPENSDATVCLNHLRWLLSAAVCCWCRYIAKKCGRQQASVDDYPTCPHYLIVRLPYRIMIQRAEFSQRIFAPTPTIVSPYHLCGHYL